MVNPLSRVAMQNIIKDKKPIISSEIADSRRILNSKESELILDIIKGNKEIIEVNKSNPILTLDEAANRVKNNR